MMTVPQLAKMDDNFEVFTTIDKAKRDELFNELRKRGLPNEKLAVKFSGVQPVAGEPGKWQSSWSVAYPKELPGPPPVIRKGLENLPSNLKEEAL
jgi:hypothetical protein